MNIFSTFTTIAVFAFSSASSQVYVNTKNLNKDSTIRYFEISYDPRPEFFFLPQVDYGEMEISKNFFTDSMGKKLRFNSGIAMLNYITGNGWKLVDRQLLASRFNQSVDKIYLKDDTRPDINANIETADMKMYFLFERAR